MIIAFYIFTFLAYFIGATTFANLGLNYMDENIGYGLHPVLAFPIATLFGSFALWLLWAFHQRMSAEDELDEAAGEAMGIQWPAIPQPEYDVPADRRQPSALAF